MANALPRPSMQFPNGSTDNVVMTEAEGSPWLAVVVLARLAATFKMFTAFQSALRDVFLVTVQKEEELTCATAAIALACLVQKYAHAPRFATHRQCLASFGAEATMESANSPQRPSPVELASAGFFHTGRADETVCGACFLGLRDWQPCDVDAEAVHARFAAGDGGSCLFLTTRRLLTSVLPLARKHLTTSPPRSDTVVAATMIERLTVIAREMAVGGSGGDNSGTDCWPVQNARVLGYSDDLILLALWRLQTEGNAVDHTWAIDPQGTYFRWAAIDLNGSRAPSATRLGNFGVSKGTTDLLKAILRVQESGLGDDEVGEDVEQTEADEAEGAAPLTQNNGEATLATEDAEVSRGSTTVVPQHPSLPCLSQLVQWWAKTWLPSRPPTACGSPRAALRRKANSTSA
ncbi:inhibitor of apoptosis protein [Echinococcus granulosus]|uniref:Inhibitor of apoptosis protein n=1 Tax=Echinococcus granulosus TaxID=6210 RepID=W6UT28_ECHGR|nr:inhibitor of apoptosis protein [Echinococcus granulosus]EUB61502.1 inhibitor of apoptosis protein [Echinococcus granulosus]